MSYKRHNKNAVNDLLGQPKAHTVPENVLNIYEILA